MNSSDSEFQEEEGLLHGSNLGGSHQWCQYGDIENHSYFVQKMYSWIYQSHAYTMKMLTPLDRKGRQEHKPLLKKPWKSLHRLPPIIHHLLIGIYLAVVFFVMAILLYYDTYAATTNFGKPHRLDCGDKYGALSKVVSDLDQWVPVRCPAYCQYRGAGKAHLWDDTTKSVLPAATNKSHPREIYSFTYDSPVCKAALSAHGLISPFVGGCFVVRVPSSRTDAAEPPPLLLHKTTNSHGIHLDMDSSSKSTQTSARATARNMRMNLNDPLNRHSPFQVQECGSRHCQTFGYSLLVVMVVFNVGLLFLSPPKPAFFASIMTMGYWYVVFVVYPTYTEAGLDRVDYALGTFFSFIVFVYAIYDFSMSEVLYDTASGSFAFDTMLLFMVPYFGMLHMSYIKPFLDYSFTPGGFSALSGWQVAFAVIITLSLLLLPMTRFSSRFSVFLSGALLGMFVNGVACYGFDSTWVMKP
eukprot:CFRG4939T1